MPIKLYSIATLLLLCLIAVAGCKAIQTPWAWLDEPENQHWIPMTIEIYGRTVQFAVPDNSRSLGTSAIRTPHLERNRNDRMIVVTLEYRKSPYVRITGFAWEHYWGGFIGKDITNFEMSVGLYRLGNNGNLLDLSIEQRKQRIRDDYRTRFESEEDWLDFDANLVIEPYKSSQGIQWTKKNSPRTMKVQEDFMVPITQYHELAFWFYYRMDDTKPRNDQAWFERRKKIARQILDTVRITPEIPPAGR